MTCQCQAAPLAASFGSGQMSYWSWIPGVATVPLADGIPAPTATGTLTLRALGSADLLTSTRRAAYVSAAAINSVAGPRSATLHVQSGLITPGTGRFKGAGWLSLWQAAISDAVLNTEASMFLGLRNSVVAPTTVDPTTIQGYGFGCKQGQTTLHVYSRDAAGNSIDIDLGGNFPTNVVGVDAFWRFQLLCPPGQSGANAEVHWAVERLNTGHQASGVIAAAAGSLSALAALTPNAHRSTGPVNAAAVGIDFTWWRFQTQL
jgi:hypothetical protein